ncbi:hypothetical protein Tco_0682335 [Tanacetum coccineum]|uniref:Uncharacterized protein n=1 Tax=Tanacetum coccineum TaxID=301880 RepID=A0ABQ4XQV3_9ASTR
MNFETRSSHVRIDLGGSNSQGTLLWPLLRGSKHQLKNKPPVNEENALVLHTSVEKASKENNLEKKVSDDEPPKPDTTTMTIDQFTEHLNKTTSSIFYPTSPRDPTLLRDPNPLRDESKGKGIATEEPLKEIMPFMEEGGSVPKIPSFKSFVIPEGS